METVISVRGAKDKSCTDESVSFSHVSAVVTGWTLDFMFVSLCRRFKEGGLDEFNETLSAFEGKLFCEVEVHKVNLPGNNVQHTCAHIDKAETD